MVCQLIIISLTFSVKLYKLLTLQNSFKDSECIYYSHLDLNSFLSFGWYEYISRIFRKVFEKELSASFHESSVHIREMYQPKGRGDLHSVLFKMVW
jgi:hypothetical protein